MYKHLEYSYGFPRVNISLVGMASLVILLMYFLINKNKINRVLPRLAFAATLLLFVILVQMVQTPFVIPYGGATIYLKTIANSIFGYTGFFLCGFFFLNIFKSIIIKNIIVIAWGALTLFELADSFGNERGFYLFMGDFHNFYVMMADSYVFLTLVVFAFCTRFYWKVVVYCLGVLTLLALLSRTSLYLFILIGGIMIFWQHKKIIILFLTILLGVVFYSNYHFDVRTLDQKGVHYRMIRLFIDKEDSSWETRKAIFSEGMMSIREHWLFGDFMGDVRDHYGETGHYIHNIFSYWRQFGILPFAVLIALLVKDIFLFFNRLYRKKGSMSNEEWFLVAITLYNVSIIVIARSHAVPYLWMLLSILPVAILTQKKERLETAKEEMACHQSVPPKYLF